MTIREMMKGNAKHLKFFHSLFEVTYLDFHGNSQVSAKYLFLLRNFKTALDHRTHNPIFLHSFKSHIRKFTFEGKLHIYK